VHQVTLYDKESRHQTGHQTFIISCFLDLFSSVHLAPLCNNEKGFAAADGAPE
jgi:hypothetical protein